MKNTKTIIMKTTLKLFMQKGYREVTMREIIGTIGISNGAFYHYFKGKEEIFHEIINQFFTEVLIFDYSRISKNTLYEFYNEYINTIENSFKQNIYGMEDIMNINYYGLIYDALKLFPEYNEKFRESHRKEIEIWSKVIACAKKTGEIKSQINNGQIAQMFICINDGIGAQLVKEGRFQDFSNELRVLWNSFYESLKS